jgi:PAS domain S-box-containing protein
MWLTLDDILYAVVMDVNEKEKLKEDLDEKDYLYSMLFNNHSSAILLIRPETGEIIDANKSALDYYGYNKEKITSMKIQNINTLSEIQVKNEMKLAAREKRNYFKFIHKLANGEERDVEVHSFPVKTHKEELLFSIIYDISDKIKQKLMFERLLVASPFAVVILNKEHKIMNANEDFIKLFQYSLEEIKGRHINPLVSPWGRKKEVDTNIKLAYKGEIVKQEGLRRRKDGSLIEVEILGYPIMYHQSVEGVYVIYSDITEKKARERQLLLFRKIMENNSEGVVITDIKGNIEWINKAFYKITGYPLKDIKGEKLNLI